MPLDANRFYLIRATNGASLMVRRGQEPPKITGGGARYSVIERPRRRSTVQWMGDDPYRMDVPILIEGWQDSRNIEMDISKINQLVHSKGDLIPPTEVYVDGGLPVKGAKWVVESIDWGSMVIWTATKGKGFRLRQDCVLHLLQSVPPELLEINREHSGTLPYIVKTGDTARSIAKKHGTTTADLKKANGMRDDKEVPRKIGKPIKVPPPSKLRGYTH